MSIQAAAVLQALPIATAALATFDVSEPKVIVVNGSFRAASQVSFWSLIMLRVTE